jgi:hypothetical protein
MVSLGALDNVTVARGAVVDVSVGQAWLFVRNNLVLDGAVAVGSADGTKAGFVDIGGFLRPAGSLTGTGEVVFGANTFNYIRNNSDTTTGDSTTLTIGPGVTIHGASGRILSATSALPILNQGLISADVAGGRITVGGGFNDGTIRNEGTIAASAGAVTMTGDTFVNAGTVRIGPTGPGGVASASSPLSQVSARAFTNAAQFEVDHARAAVSGSTKFVNSGTIRLTAGALQLSAPGFTNTGTIDLRSGGGVVFRSTNTAATLTTVRNQLISGYHGGAWDGPGIHSNSAAADASTAVGYAVVAQAGTFLGVDLLAGDVLVRHTKTGDATLDGVVNFTDLLTLARNYNATGAHWYQGDFNYDGVINFSDLLTVARNYNAAMPAADAVPDATAAFGADLAAAFAQVPEPSMGLLAAAAACGLAVGVRRRRRVR